MAATSPNYVFIGGTYRGYRLMQRLLDAGYAPDHAFVLKEDQHETSQYSGALAKLMEDASIPYRVTQKLNRADEEVIRRKTRSFAVVCGWRTLIDPSLSRCFELGMVAAHDSLLPKYRGFAPLNWAMINGERETGVTLFLINDGETDSGDVISQASTMVGPDEYAISVYERVTSFTIDLYLDLFRAYTTGTISLRKQDDSLATYTCKRTPADGRIDWNTTSSSAWNLIRGLAPPYPGAYCFLGVDRYIITKAGRGPSDAKVFAGCIPGRVLRTGAGWIEVLCGKGSIKIAEWQHADTRLVSTPDEQVRSITTTLT
jgi:methionyl-tRNA formyltransferase